MQIETFFDERTFTLTYVVFDESAGFESNVSYGQHRTDLKPIGDDINDLGPFKLSGLAICPADAPVYIKSMVDITTSAKGGGGVLREVADLVLAAKGVLSKILTNK